MLVVEEEGHLVLVDIHLDLVVMEEQVVRVVEGLVVVLAMAEMEPTEPQIEVEEVAEVLLGVVELLDLVDLESLSFHT